MFYGTSPFELRPIELVSSAVRFAGCLECCVYVVGFCGAGRSLLLCVVWFGQEGRSSANGSAWPVANPVLTCATATEAGYPSNFVADPFLYIQVRQLLLALWGPLWISTTVP
jgi:hypothetical protein